MYSESFGFYSVWSHSDLKKKRGVLRYQQLKKAFESTAVDELRSRNLGAFHKNTCAGHPAVSSGERGLSRDN